MCKKQICPPHLTYILVFPFSEAYMGMYIHMMSLASTMSPQGLCTYFTKYISCYFHVSLNKYGKDLHVYLTPLPLFLYWMCTFSITVYMCQNMTKYHIYITCSWHICLPNCTCMSCIQYILIGIYVGCTCMYILHIKLLVSIM